MTARQSRPTLVNAFVFMIFLFGIGSAALRAEVPLILDSGWAFADTTYPTWVEASAALDGRGRLDPARFHPHLLRILTEALAADTNDGRGCTPIGETYVSWLDAPDRSTTRDLVRASALTLVGRVTDRKYGFEFGVPGQMLEVEISGSLPLNKRGERVFAFVPVGRFEFAGKTICKTDHRYVTPPSIGGRVMLFVPVLHGNDNAYLDLRYPSSFAVLDDGMLSLSGEVRTSGSDVIEKGVTAESHSRIPLAEVNALLRRELGGVIPW